MSDQLVGTATCLCGSIHVRVKNIKKSFSACHCSMCRKWGGGPLMAVDCGTDVSFEGEDSISEFESSAWAERGFCRHCGTHLFYRLKGSLEYFMPVGLFDAKQLDDGQFKFDLQVFIDEKPEYYCFSNDTKQMTGAEVFAMYAPPEE